MAWLEPACAAVLAAVFAWWSRTQSIGSVAQRWMSIGVAGWLAEQAAIGLYDFYGYHAGSWLMVGRVPLMVALIWPAVVISAGQIADHWTARTDVPRWVWVALVVLIDASFVEAVSVAAGLWHWNHPGFLGVPLTGLVGWVLFAVACDALTHRGKTPWIPVAVPLVVHAGLLAAWWGVLRWVPSPEDDWKLSGVVGAVALVAIVWAGRQRPRLGLPASIWGPRALATSIFALTLIAIEGSVRLWLHAASIALLYSLLSRSSATTRSPAGPTAPTGRFPPGRKPEVPSPGA